MFAAHADGIFDLSRTKGELRRIEVEARYETVHGFLLRRERVEEGEIIRAAEDPDEAKKRELEKGLPKASLSGRRPKKQEYLTLRLIGL